MLRNSLFSLGALALLAAAATAQCVHNQFPIHFVDAQGNPRPVAVEGQNIVAQFANEAVYLAFDANTPSCIYYVHVTDRLNGVSDEVLSTNDPMDRFVTVANANNVITLSLPFTNNPNPAVFGVGLGGVGQSLHLSSLRPAIMEPCLFKAWIGDTWDLTHGSEFPYIVRGGAFRPGTTECAIASFHYFRIGDGTGSDVTGSAFLDSDRDGVRDIGEGPLANWEVQLVTGATSVSTQTDANGLYRFVDVAAANYTIELQLASGYVATTAISQSREVCGCADVAVAAFGAAPAILPCHGRTIGFWRNCHGLHIVHNRHILPTLPALYLRNLCGQHVAPGSLWSFKSYLQCANSWNMAYMLSAQLLAMHCNVIAGFVHPHCVIHDSCLGNITIGELMQRSILSLMAHGYTPPGSPWRAEQQRLKNALDNANNNRNWL